MSPSCTRFVLVAASFFFMAAPAPAAAGDRDEARELFEEALRELDAGNAATGRDLLRRSLALYPTVPTRVNLAIALRRTGEAPEAVALLEAILEDDGGALSASARARIREQLRLAQQSLATLRVRVHGADASIEVDGVPAGQASEDEELSIEVGAGEHVVVASAEGSEARSQVTVGAGEAVTVALALELVTTGSLDADQEDESGGISPWVWITIAAVALVAGGVTAAVIVATSGEEYDGSFETLRVSF